MERLALYLKFTVLLVHSRQSLDVGRVSVWAFGRVASKLCWTRHDAFNTRDGLVVVLHSHGRVSGRTDGLGYNDNVLYDLSYRRRVGGGKNVDRTGGNDGQDAHAQAD